MNAVSALSAAVKGATCTNKNDARPGPESLAVDVFSTVRSVGYPIEVLTGYEQEMNRYAFLLVE